MKKIDKMINNVSYAFWYFLEYGDYHRAASDLKLLHMYVHAAHDFSRRNLLFDYYDMCYNAWCRRVNEDV